MFHCRDEEDSNEIYRVMHTTESTYSTITPEEEEAYANWLSQRDKVHLHSLKLQLIKDHPIIQVMYRRLVPNVVSDTSFWNNYFFHMEQKGYDFSQRQESEPVSSPVIEKKEVETLNAGFFLDFSLTNRGIGSHSRGMVRCRFE